MICAPVCLVIQVSLFKSVQLRLLQLRPLQFKSSQLSKLKPFNLVLRPLPIRTLQFFTSSFEAYLAIENDLRNWLTIILMPFGSVRLQTFLSASVLLESASFFDKRLRCLPFALSTVTFRRLHSTVQLQLLINFVKLS